MVHGLLNSAELNSESESKSENRKMGIYDSPQSNSSNSSLSPPHIPNFSKGTDPIQQREDYEEFQIPVSLVLPRSVPCIVLSPSNNPTCAQVSSDAVPLFQLPVISPLDSIMAKISKLSSARPLPHPPFQGNQSLIWKQSESYHEDNLRESMELYDSMKQIVKDTEIGNDAPESLDPHKRDGDKKEKDDNGKGKSKESTISDKLSFGIDRILANCKSDLIKQDEPKPFSSLLPKTHQDFHPRYLNHCSECYLLSRFCYKYSPPRSPASGLCQSSLNYSPAPWNAIPHLYEPNSTILLPATTNAGYGHSQLAPFQHNNQANYTGISSLVSCNNNGNGRRKRSWSRAVFSNLQRKGLEKRFQIQKYITKPDRRQLAATLGLTDAQVKVWFQNRRMKWRHTKEGKSGDGNGTVLNATTTTAISPASSRSENN